MSKNVSPDATDNDESKPRRNPSLLTVLSVGLPVLVSTAVVLGFVGRTLYATREEYSVKVLQDATDKMAFQQTLARVDGTLQEQRQAFKELSATVQTLQIQMAGQQREKTHER